MEVRDVCAPRIRANTTVPKDMTVSQKFPPRPGAAQGFTLSTETGSTIVSEGDSITLANKNHADTPCDVYLRVGDYKICIDRTINPQQPNVVSLPNFPDINSIEVYKDPNIPGVAFFAKNRGYDITNIQNSSSKTSAPFNATYLALCDSPFEPTPEAPASSNSSDHHGLTRSQSIGLGLGIGLPGLVFAGFLAARYLYNRSHVPHRTPTEGQRQEHELVSRPER
jgi:hypothetical protein